MALTTYTKTAWANGTSPAINATNLGKIEDRLYDLTEEAITPTSLATTTATQEITSLPSTALKSRLDVTVKGNTYVNLIENGNFANGTTNWGTVNSTHAVTNNVLSNTGNGGSSFPNEFQYLPYNTITGEKYYFVANARVTNANSTALSLQFRESTGVVVITSVAPIQNVWYKLSGVRTLTTDYSSPYVRLAHAYIDSATANGKVMEVQNVMTINLTNLFGAGNEPTLEEADLMFENWFDDVESTGKQIVKSVGKNLLNVSQNYNDNTVVVGSGTANNVYLGDGKLAFTNGSSSSRGAGHKLKLKPNTTYMFSAKGQDASDGVAARVIIYNSYNTTTIIDRTYASENIRYTNSFTTPYDGIIFVRYLRAGSTDTSKPAYLYEIQLEEGTTATTYEEYTETTAIIPAELKQVSDSIRDTFDANLGVHTKNISDWVDLYGKDYTWITGGTFDFSGYKVVGVAQTNFLGIISSSDKILMLKYNSKKLASMNYFGNNPSSEDVAGMGLSYLNISVSDTDTGWDETWVSGTSFTGMTWANLIKAYMNGWKLTTANTNVASCVWTGIGSGTTQSGASGYTHVTTTIDTGYTPYRMIYQLKTPIVTNYYPNIINAEPSGTVYVYPFVADYDFYDNGCGVSDTTYPINSLEYVNIADKETGAFSPIDLSTCTVATGGLSFTSTALTANDLVDFGYTYKELSTIPTIEYSYPTNLKATVDGNTNNIRDLDKKQEQSTTALNLKTDEIARDLKILKLMGGL
jgi:hypothetical protein